MYLHFWGFFLFISERELLEIVETDYQHPAMLINLTAYVQIHQPLAIRVWSAAYGLMANG